MADLKRWLLSRVAVYKMITVHTSSSMYIASMPGT